MRIGFTGTSRGMTQAQQDVVSALLAAEGTELHHGDCLGADAQAHDLAEQLGVGTVIHPPTDPKLRAFKVGDEVRACRPYLQRNHDIVRETQLLIATPRTEHEELRSGTWATVRFARRLGRPIRLVMPDGTCVHP
jgi:hypothetical protein